VKEKGLDVAKKHTDVGFVGVVAAANQVWHRDHEMRPGNLFQVLDLPIIDSFLYKHGETLNRVLFKKEHSLYKEIDINLGAINKAFS